MFYQSMPDDHQEDRWGLVGQVGDPFREDRELNLPCWRCGQAPLVIAERNWMATNHDHSQEYQIRLACPACGAADEFRVNAKQEGRLSRLKHSHHQPQVSDLIPLSK